MADTPNMTIFARKNNPNLKMATENQETSSSETKYSNFVNTVKGYMKLSADDNENKQIEENKGFLTRLKESLKSSLEVETSYKSFFIVLAVGIAIICFSTVFILLAPQKFIAMFSLGSLVTLNSFIFLNGTYAHCEMLFAKNRLPFTCMYFVSIILGMYFSLTSSYLFSMICSAFQLIALIVFVLSFIPGGRFGISMIFNMLGSPFRSLYSKIFK